jgi:hypothetical protein
MSRCFWSFFSRLPRISDPAHPPIRDATLPRRPHIIAGQLATHNPHKHTHETHPPNQVYIKTATLRCFFFVFFSRLPRISDPAHPPIRDATLPRRPHIIAGQLATHNSHKHTHETHPPNQVYIKTATKTATPPAMSRCVFHASAIPRIRRSAMLPRTDCPRQRSPRARLPLRARSIQPRQMPIRGGPRVPGRARKALLQTGRLPGLRRPRALPKQRSQRWPRGTQQMACSGGHVRKMQVAAVTAVRHTSSYGGASKSQTK